ncbi:hypothetical protein ABK040_014377 [Willaertia magna]
MVQHYVLVNFTKGLCLKSLGKLVDHSSYQGMHMNDIMELLENSGDWSMNKLAIVGEYADDDIAEKLIIPLILQTYKQNNLEDEAINQDNENKENLDIANIEQDLRNLLKEDTPFDFLKKRFKGIKIHAPAIYEDEDKYLVNHSKKQYISRSNFAAPLCAALNAMITCVQDKVGKWSGDSISIVKSIDPFLKQGYKDVTDLAKRTFTQICKETHSDEY